VLLLSPGPPESHLEALTIPRTIRHQSVASALTTTRRLRSRRGGGRGSPNRGAETEKRHPTAAENITLEHEFNRGRPAGIFDTTEQTRGRQREEDKDGTIADPKKNNAGRRTTTTKILPGRRRAGVCKRRR
jgi:hypothetical protein